MKLMKLLILLMTASLYCSCGTIMEALKRPLQEPEIVKKDSMEKYKYVYVAPTQGVASSLGGVYGGDYGVYGSTVGKSLNPCDIISGELIKKGYILLPAIKEETKAETLIANYGETGRYGRGMGGGYTIEVTIQFISADSHKLVCICTAEGQGQTEADDIRIAIQRALSKL